MYLPESLQDQSFAAWNHTVKGLIQVWEMACFLGIEQRLEQSLLCDHDSRLARKLGELGNDPRRMANTLRHNMNSEISENSMPIHCVVVTDRRDLLPALLSVIEKDPLFSGDNEKSEDDAGRLVECPGR